MAKQITEKDARELLKALQSITAKAKGIKQCSKVKSTAASIDKVGSSLAKDNKDMPDQ